MLINRNWTPWLRGCTSLVLITFSSVYLSGSSLFAQPSINSVTVSPDPVGRYERLELAVDLTASYTNPFDPGEIDIWAVFTSPGSENWSVNGFWDGADWKIRFAANDTGTWSYTVHAQDSTGQDSSSAGNLNCEASPHHGWLRVSAVDPHFLCHDDGISFYGVGQCRCWDLGAVPTIFSDMHEHGMNILHYWMPSWDNMLVTLSTGYDQYDMVRAANVDAVVDSCEQHNVYLLLTIWNHDELRGAGHPWDRKYFDDYNPFHDLSTATGFMTDSTSWVYQQKLYRYIIARWGYSRAIGLWPTICEIDGTTNSWNNDTVTDPWHSKINAYFKDNDPFGHPTTASKSAGGSVWNWPVGFGVTDLPQAHVYQDGVGVSNTIASRTRTMWNNYVKPNFIGEFGAVWGTAQTTKHFHDGIWAGFAAGGAITPLDWNDGGDWEDLTPEMYDHGGYLVDFASGVPFDQLGLGPATLSIGSEFKAWGMKGSNLGYLWVQDTSPGEVNAGVSLTITGLAAGQWAFDWYDTWSGSYLPDRVVETTTGGPITTTVPSFTNDLACRIARVGEIGQSILYLDPVGDVTTWPDTDYRWKDIADHLYAQTYQDSFTYVRPRVALAFDTTGTTFEGQLTGFGLKPNFAYQMKLVGKPEGDWGEAGDDMSNEYIGYEGRWWRKEPNPGNSNDADYEAHKDDSTYIFEGYLLFDYFATDEYGQARKDFALESSFHVLWNMVINLRDPEPNDSPITNHIVRALASNAAYDSSITPSAVGLYAEWEPGRDYPGQVVLPTWDYNVQFILTEESFHQSGLGGYWASAMGHDSVTFFVNNPDPPEVTVTYPNGGETLSGSTTITWTATDPNPGETALLMADLDYSDNGGSSWSAIDVNQDNDGTYSWDVSGLSDGSDYLVRITITDTTGRSDSDTSDAVFSIDNPDEPEVTVTFPNGGETLSDSSTITWTASDPDPGETALLSLSLDYSDNNGASWSVIDSNQANDGTYLWDISNLSDGSNYLVRVTATDTTGQHDADSSDSSFGIDNTAPPAAISDLMATLADSSINLSWSAVTMSEEGEPLVVDHYDIYRQAAPDFSPDPEDSIGSSTETSYDDLTAAVNDPGVNHYYVVKAVDSMGRKSADSNTVGEFDVEMVNESEEK